MSHSLYELVRREIWSLNHRTLAPGRERRQGERFERCFSAKCEAGNGQFNPSSILDISITGVRMEAAHKYTVGSQVALHLKPESSRFISLLAKVVWVSRKAGSSAYEVGLHFVNGLAADFAWLRKWLKLPELPTTRETGRTSVRKPGTTFSCTCGAEFSLRVELAVHCEEHGHYPRAAQEVAAAPQAAPSAPARKSRLPILLALMLLTLAGYAATEAVALYTAWQPTEIVRYL